MADVGTGAGFPGVPLRILEPSIRLTLLDSLQKRIGFLGEVCQALDLSDVELVHGRAEEFAAGHRNTSTSSPPGPSQLLCGCSASCACLW